MKLLHTSDLHFGISLYGIPLIQEQQAWIHSLIELIKEKQVDGVLLAGDIFDTSVSTSEAIGLYNEMVTRICKECGVPIFMIAGNHDGAARLAVCKEILKDRGLHIAGRLSRPEGDNTGIIFGDVQIHLIPYFHLDEVKALYKNVDSVQEVKTYEQAFLVVCDEIRKHMDPLKRQIVLSHAFVSGASLSESDKSAMVGTSSMISKDVFHGFDYVALGHLHRPQNIGEQIRYSGSPLRYSLGEATQEKSVTILDTSNFSKEIVPIIPLHNMQVLTGTYEEMMETAVYCEDFIKVEITDQAINMDILSNLKNLYPNLLTVSGKTIELDQEEIMISLEEMQKLSPEEILEKFLQENWKQSVEEEQIQLFLQALEELERAGDRS